MLDMEKKEIAQPNHAPLDKKVIRGGVWVFIMRISERTFSIIRLIILARLLSPDDFGLMGIALLTLTIVEVFTEPGFQQAIIKKKKENRDYLDSAWTVMLIRGILTAAVILVSAPFIAKFFDAPESSSIIQVIALAILFHSFTNVGVVYFRKNLDFKKQFYYQMSGTMGDFIVAVTMAIVFKSVWALVFGLLAKHIIRLIMSYVIHPYRPKLRLKKGEVKELWGFGKWILGTNILLYLINNGSDILIGKVLGVTALGYYQMAYKISNSPATEITTVISQVTFPAYSKLQNNIEKLKTAFYKVLNINSYVSFFMAGLIFIFAPYFTELFMGEKWMSIVPAMQVLVFWGLIRSLAGTNSSIFLALNKPHIVTKLSFIKLIILAVIVYPLTIKWGIYGTAWAVLLPSLLITPTTFYIAIKKLLKDKYINLFKAISVSIIGMVAMVALIYPFVYLANTYLYFSIGIVMASAVYLIFTYLMDRIFKLNLYRNIFTLFRKWKKRKNEK